MKKITKKFQGANKARIELKEDPLAQGSSSYGHSSLLRIIPVRGEKVANFITNLLHYQFNVRFKVSLEMCLRLRKPTEKAKSLILWYHFSFL